METSKTSNTGFKIGLALVLLLCIGALFFSYNLYNEKKETEATLLSEKQTVLENFNAMVIKYDAAISENEIVNSDLEAARDRIKTLMESLKNSKNDINSLLGFKKKYLSLQNEMDALLLDNERLKIENSVLSTSLDSTKIELTERKEYSEALAVKNTELNAVIDTAAMLQTVGLKGIAVIERNNGKQIPTERARRSDKLKLCFTIVKNTLAEAGDKTFYIQVIDPKNNVLGENASVRFDDEVLNYSLVSQFNYENKNLDICEYISEDKTSKFEAGTYKINVFNGANRLASSQFVLK